MALKCVVSLSLVSLAFSAGCTKPNPLSCADGFCDDQAYPFCDVDGSLGGEPQTCIAVACDANAFVECRGDEALMCDAEGTNYELLACELGCEASSGCRLCEPNETACTNGTVATCDAAGNITSSEACGLGCFEDEPRCRDIDPSNGLATYVDMVDAPADLDLANVEIHTETGAVLRNGQPVMGLPSFLTPGPTGGAMIRVFVARDVRLADVVVQRNAADPRSTRTGPALAFVTTGSILVEGRVTLHGGAGGVDLAGCSGSAGQNDSDGQRSLQAGAGGGGHATAGARGGDVGSATQVAGGSAGQSSGLATLAPLRGGCPGGPTPGGGALQLSARADIKIDGIVDLRGATASGYGGGGGGGGLLVEAARVELTKNARLIATGGGGGGGAHFLDAYVVAPPNDEGLPQPGSRCEMASGTCTAGGNGAAAGIAATPGALANVPVTGESGAGGGGGGLGRIRLNTRDQTYVKSSSTIEAGDLTVGTTATR